MTPDQESLCRKALDGMKTLSLTGPLPYGPDDLSGVLQQHGIRNASINVVQRTATGFTGQVSLQSQRLRRLSVRA